MTPDATEPPVPLSPEDASRLVDFARACKAAARAVMLYPGGHPSIATTLGRIVQLNSPVNQSSPMHVKVLTDGSAARRPTGLRVPTASVTELAELLHAHLVGEIVIHAGGDLEGWRNFVQLIGRPADELRADGGIARMWTTIAGRHIEIREIDYAEVLREKSGGDPATWERVISNCLLGDTPEEDDEKTMRGLFEIASDPERLGNLIAALDVRAAAGGQTLESKTAAVVRLIQGVVESANKIKSDGLEPVLRNWRARWANSRPR